MDRGNVLCSMDQILFVYYANKPALVSSEVIWSSISKQRTHNSTSYPPRSEIRKKKLEQLSSSLSEQQRLIHRTTSTAERITEASWDFGLGKKTLSDSEIVKDCFLASAEIFFADFDNKDAIKQQIKGLQLSDSTIMRRIENIRQGC